MRLLRSSGKPRKPKFFVIRRVVGDSMAPTLNAGQVVVGFQARSLNIGDVVIITHNGLDKIKRIEKHQGDVVYLLGDNGANSTDSRTLGWLPAKSIIAKVIWPKL